jgi:hypothetical protein
MVPRGSTLLEGCGSRTGQGFKSHDKGRGGERGPSKAHVASKAFVCNLERSTGRKKCHDVSKGKAHLCLLLASILCQLVVSEQVSMRDETL